MGMAPLEGVEGGPGEGVLRRPQLGGFEEATDKLKA